MFELSKTGPVILFAVFFLFTTAWAIDFTALSNDELYELTGAIKNAPKDEQESYQKEWQLRVSKMKEKELKRFRSETETNNGDSKKSGKKTDDLLSIGRGYDRQGTGSVILGGIPPSK